MARSPPFFGDAAACRWTFTLVESMARTPASTATVRSSCNAVNRRSTTSFLDHQSDRWWTVIHLPKHSGRSRHGAPVRHIHRRASAMV